MEPPLEELNWIQQLKPPHQPPWRITHTTDTTHTTGLADNGWPDIAIPHYPPYIAKDILRQIINQLPTTTAATDPINTMNQLNITVIINHTRSTPTPPTPVTFTPGHPHIQAQLPGWPCSRCVNSNSGHQCTCPFHCGKNSCRQTQPGYPEPPHVTR